MKTRIRNFSIIAHIDHGKSTLADRILELAGAIDPREFKDQLLDDMELEREKGITIKAHAVRLTYHAEDGFDYTFHLIDTPGHVDFSYEVSRSLAACEGALLIVDATQGVEAQTIANACLAIENNLEIIPVINKIDLASADIEKTKQQIEDILGLNSSRAILASAKEGRGIQEIMESVVHNIPPPEGDEGSPLRGLIIDSWFDNYQGAVILAKIIDGSVRKGAKIRLMSNQKEHEVLSLGIYTPKAEEVDSLSVGEVGYLVSGIRDVGETKIGDTITDAEHPASTPIPDYKEVKSMVFCGLYTIDTDRFEDLR
ncbi:MAG: GTP-binding protein, partial [Nitrospiria bacterium]